MTGAEQRGREALEAVQRYGAVNRLPDLVWTVAEDGTLTGEPAGGDRRAAVDLWAVHLGARTEQTTNPDGTVHLQAAFTWDQDETAMAHGVIRTETGGGAA